ncbi:MAG: hypothetical protein U5L00_10980 [Desulfovermiculus sp.]|nr:hypothetical protein [Desulfovermiculus sp.]
MKQKTRQLMNKAEDAIEAAELLLKGEKPEFAAGRAYYAMFVDVFLSDQSVEELIRRAREFLQVARGYLEAKETPKHLSP